MLSTFMKITRVNKLQNKIINYSSLFSSVSNCEQIALQAEMSCNLFVFVEMTTFGAVKQ